MTLFSLYNDRRSTLRFETGSIVSNLGEFFFLEFTKYISKTIGCHILVVG
jgi:hypothetical protein